MDQKKNKSKQRFLKKARKNFCPATRALGGRYQPCANRAGLIPASQSPRRRAKVFWLLFFKKVTA
jgi:hypothetical protein